MMQPAFLTCFRLESGQFSELNIWAENVGTDRLVADTGRLAFKPQSACDLFWRPALFEQINFGFEQPSELHQLPS